jgi:hypothetical protein
MIQEDHKRVVNILVVEDDMAMWDFMEMFFQRQFARYFVDVRLTFEVSLPERAFGYDLVSLDNSLVGGEMVQDLPGRPDLVADLRQTPVVNIHSSSGEDIFADVKRIIGPHDGLMAIQKFAMSPISKTEYPFEMACRGKVEAA